MIRSVMCSATAADVAALYNEFPYPSRKLDDPLILDVANSLRLLFSPDALNGKRILDAGCGTGHRTAAVARAFPGASVVGIDIAEESIAVASTLASRHNVQNLRLRQASVLDPVDEGPFDLILSTGVLHHLEDPRRGLANLAQQLAPNGMMMLWFYHSLGEHQRLLDRELIEIFWNRETGMQRGVELMRELEMQISPNRYGRIERSARDSAAPADATLDVDAFLHPIVHAFRFSEALELCGGCPGIEWSAISSFTLHDRGVLLDLADAEPSRQMRYLCQDMAEVIRSEGLRARLSELGKREKLRVLELVLKPNGFTVLCGRGSSLQSLGPRVGGNVLDKEAGGGR